MSGVKRYVVRGKTEDGAGGHFCAEVVLAYDYDRLEQECERLRDQVKILQSDANSWQSGYNRGRKDRVAHGRSERDAALKQVEGLRNALSHILAMQTRGYVALGDHATSMANDALQAKS